VSAGILRFFEYSRSHLFFAHILLLVTLYPGLCRHSTIKPFSTPLPSYFTSILSLPFGNHLWPGHLKHSRPSSICDIAGVDVRQKAGRESQQRGRSVPQSRRGRQGLRFHLSPQVARPVAPPYAIRIWRRLLMLCVDRSCENCRGSTEPSLERRMAGECSATTNVGVAIRRAPVSSRLSLPTSGCADPRSGDEATLCPQKNTVRSRLGISIGADGSHNPAPRTRPRGSGTNCTDEPRLRTPCTSFRDGGSPDSTRERRRTFRF
jgi:hypothetical protein